MEKASAHRILDVPSMRSRTTSGPNPVLPPCLWLALAASSPTRSWSGWGTSRTQRKATMPRLTGTCQRPSPSSLGHPRDWGGLGLGHPTRLVKGRAAPPQPLRRTGPSADRAAHCGPAWGASWKANPAWVWRFSSRPPARWSRSKARSHSVESVDPPDQGTAPEAPDGCRGFPHPVCWVTQAPARLT